MDPQATGRRIKAARAIAGLKREDLAARIEEAGEAGLGAKTLGNMERGTREPQPRELRVIADACGVPYEFFTTDLDRLAHEGAGDQLRRLEARVNDLYTKVEEGVAALEKLSAAIAPVTDGLDDVRELRDLFVAANPKDDDTQGSAPARPRRATGRRAKGS